MPLPKHFVDRVRAGGVTLVLGAGISLPRGIPSWDELARKLWKRAFPHRRSPWKAPTRFGSPKELPQFLPIVFELTSRQLKNKGFIEALRREIYTKARFPEDDPKFKTSSESLAVLARTVVDDFTRQGARRIDAILTLNADDLLERAIDHIQPSAGADIVFRIIARTIHPHFGGLGTQPTPIYHLHGFLPSARSVRFAHNFEHQLVFTDSQYWSTSATALSFANRAMSSALNESRCIFVGLSMTDINLLRWLAIRTVEVERDREEGLRRRPGRNTGPGLENRYVHQAFMRHFWIRPKSDDPMGLLSEFLELRGIQPIEIDSWRGNAFQTLMSACFPVG